MRTLSENSTLEDSFAFILQSLLRSTETDPFCTSDILIYVTRDGDRRFFDFPGFFFPFDPISIHLVDFLITQDEWEVTWDQRQLSELSSARSILFTRTLQEIDSHICFWVAADAATIRSYLDTKVDLLRKFLKHNLFQVGRKYDYCIKCLLVNAMTNTMRTGGGVIAILTEHFYGSPDKRPWYRYRFKKLVLVEKWLVEVFQLLIRMAINHQFNSEAIERLSQRAQDINARTHHAWATALAACIKEHPHISDSELVRLKLTNDNIAFRGNECSEEVGENENWETEDTNSEQSSGWETEEEMEEGYMLEKTTPLDNHDAKNPDLSDDERCTCTDIKYWEDFDYRYWSHIHPPDIPRSDGSLTLKDEAMLIKVVNKCEDARRLVPCMEPRVTP